MATVTIGCRLPNGLIIELEGKPPVKLNGQNSAQANSPIIMLSPADCGYTEVDADFWQAWKTAYKGYQPLESQAIFEAKNSSDAKAIHREIKNEKTGLEPMPQTDGKIEKAE